MGLLSGIGMAIGGLGGSLLQRNWAKDDAKMAFERDITGWMMNNAYNDPAAQMQRLKAAGLNPNLVYGNGSVTGNASGSAPSGTMARSSNISVGDEVLKGQQLLANDATIENTRAEEKVRREQAEQVKVDTAVKKHNLKVAKKTGTPVGDNSIYVQGRRFLDDLVNDKNPRSIYHGKRSKIRYNDVKSAVENDGYLF